MNYEDANKLLNKYRRSDRPKFYSAASGQETQISAEFEAELILMENSTKRSLIQRLKNISSTSTKNTIASALLSNAVTADLAVESDRVSELQAKLGDIQAFEKKLTDASSSSEMASVVGVISKNAGTTLFEYDLALNRVIHAATMQQKMDGTDYTKTKTELSSWISVISSYITG